MTLLKYTIISIFIIMSLLGIAFYLILAPDKPVDDLLARWAPKPSQFINIKGMPIHIRDEGPKSDKEPIVLIHGTSATLHTWDGWVTDLKDNHRVIRFDLPGFGLTGPDINSNYKIEHYAEIVVAVLDKLQIKSAVLAGNSLGGYISWATAVLHPKRVSKLILVDASGYDFDPESVPLAFKLAKNPLTSSLLERVLPRSLVEKSVRNVYGNPELVTEELIDRYYELTLRAGNRGALKERFEQTLPGALKEQVKNIDIPTLILWGRMDKLIPLKFGYKFSQEIKNSKLIIFDDLGHVPHEENPDATVKAVNQFLQGS